MSARQLRYDISTLAGGVPNGFPDMPEDHSLDESIGAMPHVVILGAGASRACCPDGDVLGRSLPLMAELVGMLGLREMLAKHGLDTIGAFETQLSLLLMKGGARADVEDTKTRIRKYFSSLKLPAEATIYDELMLALTEKDLIATFNWDPLLSQAAARCPSELELPTMAFLHGNVTASACLECRHYGLLRQVCSSCGKTMTPTELIYPVTNKNYDKDPFISGQWEIVREYLEKAYLITIFGYSAPRGDVEAIHLLSEAWTQNSRRNFGEIELIDIVEREELKHRWSAFVVRNHCCTHRRLRDSWLFDYPRRSCEAFAAMTLQNLPWPASPIPRTNSLDELHSWALGAGRANK